MRPQRSDSVPQMGEKGNIAPLRTALSMPDQNGTAPPFRPMSSLRKRGMKGKTRLALEMVTKMTMVTTQGLRRQ